MFPVHNAAGEGLLGLCTLPGREEGSHIHLPSAQLSKEMLGKMGARYEGGYISGNRFIEILGLQENGRWRLTVRWGRQYALMSF